MLTQQYTIIVANRKTGTLTRFTMRLGSVLLLITLVLGVLALAGLGTRWSAMAETAMLRAANARLELENGSFREATAALTSQIASLQTAIAEVTDRADLDPAAVRAIERLPAVLKTRAMGGEEFAVAGPLFAAALNSPDNAFGVLQDLLGTLEDRLRVVATGIERWQALAAATPSIWPAHGWLSGTFGRRRDPFTGEPAFHPALDIAADKGQPVYATADGTVVSAGFRGAYGNLVEISHGFGLATRYAHLSRFAVGVGDTVRRGDVIGSIGSTGRTTGAHLHYEVWANGKPLNPLQLLVSRHPARLGP